MMIEVLSGPRYPRLLSGPRYPRMIGEDTGVGAKLLTNTDHKFPDLVRVRSQAAGEDGAQHVFIDFLPWYKRPLVLAGGAALLGTLAGIFVGRWTR